MRLAVTHRGELLRHGGVVTARPHHPARCPRRPEGDAGYLFNLSGADDVGDYAVGGAFLLLAALYLACAVRIPSGTAAWRTLAIGLTGADGLFNAIVKVGMEGETVSLMFVVLAVAVIGLLTLPRTRGFFDSQTALSA